MENVVSKSFSCFHVPDPILNHYPRMGMYPCLLSALHLLACELLPTDVFYVYLCVKEKKPFRSFSSSTYI
jgi:hypothetical protein